MQTSFLPSHGENNGRGTICDSTIAGSGLTALIKQTFADLQLPPGIGGRVELHQRQNNPDAFDLYFCLNVDSETYRDGGTYSAPDIAVFERTDFEHFAETDHLLRRRLQEFARRLVSGELEPANYG